MYTYNTNTEESEKQESNLYFHEQKEEKPYNNTYDFKCILFYSKTFYAHIRLHSDTVTFAVRLSYNI